MGTLSSLLHILKDPSNPNFAKAVDQLSRLEASTIDPKEFHALLGQLNDTITSLEEQRRLTATELDQLRSRHRALKAYGNRG